MEGEESDERDPGEHAVRAEEIPEGAREVAVGVERHAVQQAGEADAPDERRAVAPYRVGQEPDRAPAWARALRAPLEREHADDEEEEHEQEREVEAREHRRVPGGERGERRRAGNDEPDLVPVPDGADRLDLHVSLGLVLWHEGEQHADPEVEAFEQEVGRPEKDDDPEPEGLEIHQ